jgi:hypothetical protein
MRCNWIFATILCLPLGIVAQNAPPSGTIIPVSLDTSLNAAKIHPGQMIRATVMQDIPGTAIHRHAKVEGQVVKVGATTNGQIEMEIRFDTVKTHSQMVPIQTNLRALASFMEVEEAKVPEEMGSRGLTPETWTTQQIGGDQFYRGGGPVASGPTTVGQVTPWGALDVPRAQPGQPCRGTTAENNQPQAVWLFSSDACGVYGFSNIRIQHAGRSDPRGTIVLSSTNGKLIMGSGTGMLLRISSPAAMPRS